MSSHVTAVTGGLSTTVQDAGRPGTDGVTSMLGCSAKVRALSSNCEPPIASNSLSSS